MRVSRCLLTVSAALGGRRGGAFGVRLCDENVIFVMGGPGAGKGTQCAKLASKLDLCHLSAGELLRQEVASGSVRGKSIAKTISEGKIVQSSTTVGLLVKELGKRRGPFLIDGFPRSLENLRAYEESVGDCSFMLYLEVPEDEMLCRLLNRGKSSGRSDDNELTIRKRFRTFMRDSLPVVAELEARGLLRRVDAMGDPDVVYDRVCSVLAQESGFERIDSAPACS